MAEEQAHEKELRSHAPNLTPRVSKYATALQLPEPIQIKYSSKLPLSGCSDSLLPAGFNKLDPAERSAAGA